MDRLEEIKARLKASRNTGVIGAPLFSCDDADWLIAEVERLRAKIDEFETEEFERLRNYDPR